MCGYYRNLNSIFDFYLGRFSKRGWGNNCFEKPVQKCSSKIQVGMLIYN